jgi:hypothetical protein
MKHANRLAHGGAIIILTVMLLAPRPVAGQDAASKDLPEGPGRMVLLSACTACHDLKEVTKFRGFYTKDEWRDIVVTMVKYGASVKDEDVPVLVDYLFKNFGKKEEPPPAQP